MPRIETYFDEMIKSLTLANLNYMEAILKIQDEEKSWFLIYLVILLVFGILTKHDKIYIIENVRRWRHV